MKEFLLWAFSGAGLLVIDILRENKGSNGILERITKTIFKVTMFLIFIITASVIFDWIFYLRCGFSTITFLEDLRRAVSYHLILRMLTLVFVSVVAFSVLYGELKDIKDIDDLMGIVMPFLVGALIFNFMMINYSFSFSFDNTVFRIPTVNFIVNNSHYKEDFDALLKVSEQVFERPEFEKQRDFVETVNKLESEKGIRSGENQKAKIENGVYLAGIKTSLKGKTITFKPKGTIKDYSRLYDLTGLVVNIDNSYTNFYIKINKKLKLSLIYKNGHLLSIARVNRHGKVLNAKIMN